MRVFLNCMGSYPDNNIRYLITDSDGEQMLLIPDLMNRRYYGDDMKLRYVASLLKLPRFGDIIEYDTSISEWFIVKHVSF